MVAVDLLYEYMGYTPQVVDTLQNASSHIDDTVLTIPRLSAFISTVIYCVCDGSVNRVGGICLEPYYDTFSSLLAAAFLELIKTTATIVLQSCAKAFKVLSLEIKTSASFVPLLLLGQATVEMFAFHLRNDD